jgi:hypothetical protein
VNLPRFIRLRDAPEYLGMDRNRFNAEVRPSLTEIPIGVQGVAFDRLDLDAWADQYKRCNGRPGTLEKGDTLWGARKAQGCASGAMSGISTSKSEDMARFAKALEQVTSKKRSAISPSGLRKSGKPQSTG